MPFSHPIHTYPNTGRQRPSTNASTSPDRRHRRTACTQARVALQSAKSTPQPTPLLRLDGASGKLGATCAHTDTHTAVASTTVHHTSPYRSAKEHASEDGRRGKAKNHTGSRIALTHTRDRAHVAPRGVNAVLASHTHIPEHTPTTPINQCIHIT